ncbi:MAG: hypothetical protein E7532_00040 [Ruminococcaceae bacterium]|nr:hypothetical protein [Oscillospiraceae bacterium]
MKKLYYVTCLIVIASVLASGFIITVTSESKTVENTKNSSSVSDDGYIIKAMGDRIVVYKGKGEKPYLETTCAVSSLPKDVQVKIKNGIYFDSEEEMQKALSEFTS